MSIRYLAAAVLVFTIPFAAVSLLMFVQGCAFLVYPTDHSALPLGLLFIVIFGAALTGYAGGWKFALRREPLTEKQLNWLFPSILLGLFFCAPFCYLALFDPYESFWAKPQEIFFDYRVAALLLFTAGSIALLSLLSRKLLLS